MRIEVRPCAELTGEEQAALRNLSLAVYPPEVAGVWPGRAIQWASPGWNIIGWDEEGGALCSLGLNLRDARWNERAVKIGGIGGVKTHPTSRKQGFATAAIQRALDFFREQGEVDFGLLVCEPGLVPFYESRGWLRIPGELLVTQRQATVPFTFNLPMTIPVRLREPLTGTIDLQGPPW
jgi:aminoglycoside 2'-N-acetyltransferase I